MNWEKGIIRRQGDLANLVQLSEALKCYHIVAGISPVKEGVLKIMPRLPKGWEMDIADYDLQNANGKLNVSVSYPKDGTQIAKISLVNSDINNVELRFGPFAPETKNVMVRVNGKAVECRIEQSGDSKWAWVNYSEFTDEDIITLIYSETDVMPEWPVVPHVKATDKNSSNILNGILIGLVSALALLGIGFGAYYVKKKKG